MEEKIVIVLNEMSEYLSITQMKKLQEVIIKTFADNEASKVEISNEEFLKMFLDAKRIEGCSERTIIYYQANSVAHNNKKLGVDEAMLCLENLFIYLDYIAYCYSTQYEEHSFDKTIITSRIEKAKKSKEAVAATKNELEKEQQKSAKQELDLKKLIAENASLRDELSARRQEQQPTYVPKPLDLSEYKTRKLYIDSMLTDAGWTEGEDWLNEVELSGMPNKSETGFADYVLYDDMHRPLAVTPM